MDKKNHSRSNDVEEDDHNRQVRDIGRWDCIHKKKNVCPKQQEAQREDPIREL